MTEPPDIQLKLSRHQTVTGLKYQRLTIELTGRDRIIHPQDLRKLTGRAPIWLYGYPRNFLYARRVYRLLKIRSLIYWCRSRALILINCNL